MTPCAFDRIRTVIVLCPLALFGCTSNSEIPPPETPAAAATSMAFRDVAKESGLEFQHSDDGLSEHFFPSIMCGGAALTDLDEDGDIDAIFLDSHRPAGASGGSPSSNSTSQIFLQQKPGTFSSIPQTTSGLFPEYANGITCGDVNNDGQIDVYVTSLSDDRLLLNQGSGQFGDVTAASGIRNLGWASSAAFLDYDRDGWLDLYVSQYVDYDPGRLCTAPDGRADFCNPATFPRTSDKLYRNITATQADKSAPVFQDVSLEAGISEAQGAGLGVLTCDFNHDAWPDIYVANDGHGNFLWINQKNGTFREEAFLRGVAVDPAGVGQGSMGVAVSDLNHDEFPDLLVTNLDGEANAVYLSSEMTYLDASASNGVAAASFEYTGFGTAVVDLENDGDLDIVTANGRVRRGKGERNQSELDLSSKSTQPNEMTWNWRPYEESNVMLIQHDGAFRKDMAASNELTALPGVARAICVADVNTDGLQDLLVSYLDRPFALYLNGHSSSTKGHWLNVRLVEPQFGGRDAIGARLSLRTAKKTYRAWLCGGGSYQCQSALRLHFGLGAETEYQDIEVLWPDGSRESFGKGTADVQLTLRHGEGQPSPDTL